MVQKWRGERHVLIFIKNVVAVAAYSRLASRSQAKFQTMKMSPLSAPVRSRTCPEHCIHLSFTSIFASLVCGCQSEHALSQRPSQANSSIEMKIVCGCRNARQSLPGVDIWWSRFWSRSRFYFVSVSSHACVDKMAEPKSCDRSSSTESQLKFLGCMHYRRCNDNHYRCQQCHLNKGLTLFTEDSPCEVCKDWLPEAWQAQEKANEQKRKCKAAKAAKKSQEREPMDDSVEIHAPEDALQLPPTKRKSDGSSKTKRAKTATGSGSKATEVEQSAGRPSRFREPKKSVSSSVSVVEWPKSDGGSESKGSEHHRSRSGERHRRSHGSDRRQDSPRSHHSSRHDSGRREGEWTRPTLSGGSSSRRQADSTIGPGSSRVSSRPTDVRPSGSSSHSHHHHHKTSVDRRSLSSSSSRASADRKSLPGHHQGGRRESAERSGSSYVSRREVQLSPAIAQSPERRTIMVIPSPNWPEHIEESAVVTGPAEVDDPAGGTGPTDIDGPADDDPASDSPADDSPADNGSAGDGSARGPVMVTDDEPEIVDDPEEVADPAHSQESAGDGPAHDDDDPAGVAGPAHLQNPAVDGPAVVDGPVAHGTPAGNMPAAGQDVSSLLFPSLPRAINQTTLIDFMSMWTLMQRRMYLGMAVPYAQARPAAQSTVPTPRDDDTPPRRSKTPPRAPDRQPTTPVRRSRTPVRRTRVMDDTRESTRSCSPIRKSSSSESPPRDASPVNFLAALDSEDKVKDRSITDDEDEDSAQKKVSAAQYQLFWQAVMTSKGSFKVIPAKSLRASRASLLDLGDSEVTDRVSWLDQPSLKDTMASTARIVQGLKEDEEVEETTLSETLNTSSSTFKHFTVNKQIFLREPYRLKIHRDAQYVPKPPGETGFSDTKAPSSYQKSHRMCLDTEELARRSAIYASLADSMVASVIEELSPKDERTKLLREKLDIIQEAQVSAVSAGVAATSNLQLWHRDALLKNFGFQPQVLSTVRTGTVRGFACSGSRAQGPSEQSENHQTGGQDGHQSRLPRNTVIPSPAWKRRHPGRQRQGHQSSTVWGLLLPPRPREQWHRSRPFALALAGEPATDPTPRLGRSLASLLQLPQPDNVDGSQVGARLAGFAPHWRSLLGNCWANGIVEDGVGIAFQQQPQLTHQCISFWTRNSRQDLQQAVWCLAAEGSHRAGHQRDIPRVLQRVVPGPKEDGRSAACDRSPLSTATWWFRTLRWRRKGPSVQPSEVRSERYQ